MTYIYYGKFPIWVILGGVVFQCGSWISNYSNVGRFGYIRRLHCLTIPIWPFLRPQRLNALHTAYRTTLSMDCHSICDSPITQYSHRRTTSRRRRRRCHAAHASQYAVCWTRIARSSKMSAGFTGIRYYSSTGRYVLDMASKMGARCHAATTRIVSRAHLR